MAEFLRLRRLNAMIFHVVRAKREVCGVDEYFDDVVGQCSLCDDICLPQRGTMNVCAINCPSVYRRMMDEHHHLQQHQHLSTEDAGDDATTFPGLDIVIPVIVSFGVLFLVSVALAIVCCRRHGLSFCTKSPKDECTETDVRGPAIDSRGGASAEKERLNADLERGMPALPHLPIYFSSSEEAEEALSSLCSAEINLNQVHHRQQEQHHLQQTPMNVI